VVIASPHSKGIPKWGLLNKGLDGALKGAGRGGAGMGEVDWRRHEVRLAHLHLARRLSNPGLVNGRCFLELGSWVPSGDEQLATGSGRGGDAVKIPGMGDASFGTTEEKRSIKSPL
jgi:hypothetical protein